MGVKIAIVGMLALMLAACGGSGTNGRTSPPPTRAVYAAAANSVCRTTKTHQARIAGLQGLKPPPAEKDLVGHWLNAERSAVDAAKMLADPKKKEPDPRIQLVVAEGKIAGYARRVGATACATMPS